MDLKQIAEKLNIPAPILAGAKPKPKLRVIQGGKTVDKPRREG